MVFGRILPLARQVREQTQRQRGPKVYSLHAPEVECIGKGKAHPATLMTAIRWATVIPEMEALVGNTIERILADKGYRGHNAPPDYKFRVFTSGQKRRVTPKIRRELRRRSAVEPVIGHLKSEHRMGRNYLWYRQGDAINAVLAAAGYNLYGVIAVKQVSTSHLLVRSSWRPSPRPDLDFRLAPRTVTVKGGRRPSRSDLPLTVTSTAAG
jgi:transposase, IS5 family